jgi:hypothetical protein
MTVRFLVLCCGALAVARPSRAQDVTPPPIVVDGFRALLGSGIDKGVEVWFKGSALEGDTSKTNPFSRAFTELPSWLGKARDFEILKTYATGAHIRRTYAILLFEGGPAYWRFDYFLGPRGWVIQHIDFNTEADKILPSALLPP